MTEASIELSRVFQQHRQASGALHKMETLIMLIVL
jgi:hypothetical protein